MTYSIIIIIFSSFLFAITNHIDKFLVTSADDDTGSVKTLLVFSTLVAGIVLTPIWLLISKFSISIKIISLISIFLAALLYILATYFYFKALEKNDASIIAVMLQLNPVFCYILGVIFFNEIFNIQQLIGAAIIVLSTIMIMIDFKDKNNKSNLIPLCLMFVSCLCFGSYFILFDIAIRNSSYNACAFWYQISLLLIGVMLICIKHFRIPFLNSIKIHGKRYFSFNALNEFLNLIGNLLLHFTNLTIPLALVNVLNGLQGMFVFLLGILGTKVLPKYFKETLELQVIFQKVSCIILSIIGLIIMFL